MPAPNPGTEKARNLGCTCPVLDNSYGKGYMCQPGVFVYTEGCPLHLSVGIDPAREDSDDER